MVEIILGIGSFELSLGETATFDDISGFLPTDRVEGLDEALSDKADKVDVYTKGEVDTRLDSKANASEVYTKSETDGLLGDKANASEVYTKAETNTLLDNKANVSDLASKQNTLTAGDNITIVDDVISASGSVDDVQINDTSILDENKIAKIKASASNGVGYNQAGLYVAGANQNEISLRNKANRPIVTTYLDYAVKCAMTDGKGAEWTEAEKANARARMGVDAIENRVEVLEKMLSRFLT